MEKSFRRKLASLLIILLTFSLIMLPNSTVLASENNYSQYEKLISEGILGEDVTFDMWQGLVNESKMLEKFLENSEHFTLVRKFTKENSHELMSLPPDPNNPVIHDGGSGSDFRAGDIFVTNATPSWGITGHAGILLTNGNILHIAGVNYSPQAISIASWHRGYTNKKSNYWTKVYRCNSTSAGQKAANWAYNIYYNSGAKYKITKDLSTTNETYCSKLVWQAYRYGAGKNYVTDARTNRFVLPYALSYEISVYHKYTFD